MKVEAEALKLYGDQLGEQIIQLEHQIYEMAGEEFNINSPKQLGVILFEKLNMPHAKKTKPDTLQRQMCWKNWQKNIRS